MLLKKTSHDHVIVITYFLILCFTHKDKSKCACWQMTIESTAVSASGVTDPKAGYVNRRLADHLPTG